MLHKENVVAVPSEEVSGEMTANMYNSLVEGLYDRFLKSGRPVLSPRWDDELERFLFFGALGQHRVRLCSLEGPEACDASIGGATPVYIVQMRHYASLSVRAGMAAYGADAQFDVDGRLLQITSPDGRRHTPPGVGSTASSEETWAYWKFVLRSTLVAVATTFVDHLLLSHMLVSNHLVMATHEALPPNHPLRVFLTPFIYGTVEVNERGAACLLDQDNIMSRSTALKSMGDAVKLSLMDEQIPEDVGKLPFSEEFWAEVNPELRRLPFYHDGHLYYQALERLVDGVFNVYKNTGRDDAWCLNGTIVDRHLERFVLQLASYTETFPEDHKIWGLKVRNCHHLRRMLTATLFMCTGWHRQVGDILELLEDPSLTTFSWRPGEVLARPREAVQANIIAAFTKRNYPGIGAQSFAYLGEECHEGPAAEGQGGCDKPVAKLFGQVREGGQLTALLDAFVGPEMTKLEAAINAENGRPCEGRADAASSPVVCRKNFPYLIFHPQYLEMSLAV